MFVLLVGKQEEDSETSSICPFLIAPSSAYSLCQSGIFWSNRLTFPSIGREVEDKVGRTNQENREGKAEVAVY